MNCTSRHGHLDEYLHVEFITVMELLSLASKDHNHNDFHI